MIMKRKTIYHIIGLLAAVCCLWSCQNEIIQSNNGGNGKTLTLDMVTRASDNEEAGNPIYNENTITRADVFFFESTEGKCIYAQTGITPSADNKLQVALGDAIKPGGNYYIYVVANYDFFDTTGESPIGLSIADIKNKVVTTVWKDGLTNINDVIESSLVMDGEADVTVSMTEPETINLTRAMAKIAVYPTAEDEIVVGEGDDKVIYTPVYNRMNVTLVNGVKQTNLAGTYQVQQEDYVVRMKREFADEDKDGSYTHVPFYSYPNPVTTTNRKDSYLILCLPWSMKGEETQQALNYYYRVPITGDDTPAELLRNNYYKVNVHVGVLGSLDPKKAVTLESQFEILDWNTMEISTEMQIYQYLVLDEYHSVMNNVDELEMPYISSSEIDWTKTKVSKVTYPDYSKQDTQIRELNTQTQIQQKGFKLEPSENSRLKFIHVLDRVDDYVPFDITIDVYNIQGIHTQWTITQYPDIYIVAEKNVYGQESRFVNGYWKAGGGSKYNLNVYDDRGNSLNIIQNILASEYDADKNQNQYTIYITSFEAGQEYTIGDPRTFEVEEILDNRGRKRFDDLRNYYPARKDDVSEMLTPAYKVASSWAGAESMNYETAKARCASYQENGYPAGRWRMPTEAEIDFMVDLSKKGKIPQLFLLSGSGRYWASSGRTLSKDGWTTQNSTAFMRCVYDVWYWSDTKLSELPNSSFSDTDFVWGDGDVLRKGNKKN